jgi:hypothetical protein
MYKTGTVLYGAKYSTSKWTEVPNVVVSVVLVQEIKNSFITIYLCQIFKIIHVKLILVTRKIIASICVIRLAKIKTMPPERIELPTPGLQDQCSTTELKRHVYNRGESYGTDISSASIVKTNIPVTNFQLGGQYDL